MAATESDDQADRQPPQVPAEPDSKAEPDLGREQKTGDILAACRRRSIEELRLLAESEGGFLTDSLRRKACSFLSPSPPPGLAAEPARLRVLEANARVSCG